MCVWVWLTRGERQPIYEVFPQNGHNSMNASEKILILTALSYHF